MSDKNAELLVEIPEDLRLEVLKTAIEKDVDIAWLVNLYRRGFKAQVGATGQFPYGKLRRDDEGELTAAVAVDVRNGVIRMEFGKPVAWLALPSAHARHWAKMLLEKADELDRKKS